VRNMGLAWLVTLPASGMLAVEMLGLWRLLS
jgi:phosphate/sulfate permease